MKVKENDPLKSRRRKIIRNIITGILIGVVLFSAVVLGIGIVGSIRLKSSGEEVTASASGLSVGTVNGRLGSYNCISFPSFISYSFTNNSSSYAETYITGLSVNTTYTFVYYDYSKISGSSFSLIYNPWGSRFGMTYNSAGYYTRTFNMTTHSELQFICDNIGASGRVDGFMIIYNGEYNADYIGYLSGYTDGYNSGAEQSKAGIFAGATVDLEISNARSDSDSTLVDSYYYGLTPDFGYNSMSVKREWYNNYGVADLGEQAVMTVNFAQPFKYSAYTVYRFGDDTPILGSNFVTTSGDYYEARVRYDTDYPVGAGNYILYIPDVSAAVLETIEISKIELGYGRTVDTFYPSGLGCLNGGYSAGYSVGYNNGRSIGTEEGYSSGYSAGENAANSRVNTDSASYQSGYSTGSQEGYSSAVNEGVSQLGIWNGALAFIRAFFVLSGNFLDHKIVGDITLGMIFIGLPAAFMIINLTIGLLKKWLGGKGAD